MIKTKISLLSHRGPDNEKFGFKQKCNFGHTKLSIIDYLMFLHER